MEEFCSLLPKIELHAHINGSCSEATILKLIRRKQTSNPSWRLPSDLRITASTSNLEECFSKFQLIHELCDSEEAAYMITSDVIQEFAQDNVRYLELRTTPRDVASTRMTKSSYIESVLKAIRDASASSCNEQVVVKLLLSVDRAKTLEDAWETVRLKEIYSAQTDTIVGLDLSGNPTVGDMNTFLPVLKQAKQKCWKTSFHVAEVPGRTDEAEMLISLRPDRIGHATFLHPSHLNGRTDLIDKVISDKIPIELCLTSNVKSGTVAEYSRHQFEFWYQKNHPCVLCTDDKGVFSTSLSAEYYHTAFTFGLTREDVFNLSYNSIDFSFSDASVRKSLRDEWNCFKTEHLQFNS